MNAVATDMTGNIIHVAPERLMLRYGYQNSSTSFHRSFHFRQDPFVFLNVLQHIEGANDIEFLAEWNIAGIQDLMAAHCTGQ